MAEIKIEIGQRMLSLRKNIKKSQAEVAEYLGLTVAGYQNYETGRREANYETLSKLADFYGVTTDYLLGRTDIKPDPVELLTSMEDEQKLVKAYFNLPPQLRANFLQSLLEELHRQEGANITVTRSCLP